MAKAFRPVRRDQEFLLAPNMIDWLAHDHVVWFVIDVVAELDLTELYARAALRRDGRRCSGLAGRAGYDPGMLLALLIYAYAGGERSSRQIERLCHTDVACRLICAGDVPDHTVIARFRQMHAKAFAGLFTQVLRLCRATGLVQLRTVAIDGSKIAANASRQANRGADWFAAEAERMDRETAAARRGERPGGERRGGERRGGERPGGERRGGERSDREVVERMLAEAERVDAAEDAQHGSARGDELPANWRDRAGRRERIRAAQALLAAAEQARLDEQAAATAAAAERAAAELAAAEVALAAEKACREAAAARWEQAWEHAAATPGQPLPRGRAPLPSHESARVRRALHRVDRARHRVAHPDTAPRPGRRRHPDRADKQPRVNLTDPDSSLMPTPTGWGQCYNPQFSITADQIILATAVSTNPADIASFEDMITRTEQAIAALDATTELGTVLLDAGYASDATLAAPGPDRLIALGKTHSIRAAARDNPATGPPPPQATPRQAMDHRLRTPEGATLYKRRGATVEPGIANFKKILNRFSRRGLAAATSEVNLAATVFNLLKIHRATHA